MSPRAWCAVSLASTLLVASTSALAQAPSDPPADAPPAPPPIPAAAPPAPIAPPSVLPTVAPLGADDGHARKTLAIFAAQERSGRLLAGYATLLSGAGAAGAGLLADLEYNQEYGKPLWILGIALGISGVVTLLKAGPIESLEQESITSSPEQLRADWSERAAAAKRTRQISGVVSMALGVVAGGAGGMVAGGVGELTQSEKEGWSVTLIGASGALLGSGLTSLLVESPAEVGFRSAYGEVKPRSTSFTVAPTQSGGTVGVVGTF